MPAFNAISRRDFLKFSSVALGSLFAGALNTPGVNSKQFDATRPNILIILFDTFSGLHTPLNGYPRATTPNLERFASHANVYHAHYSGGSFTTSSTASLLTGLYPWTHRANHLAGLVRRDQVEHNIFQLLGDLYDCTAFTQNIWADLLLSQFDDKIDRHLSPAAYSLIDGTIYSHISDQPDRLNIFRGTDEFGFLRKVFPGLPTITAFRELIVGIQMRREILAHQNDLPYGIPDHAQYHLYSLNDQVYDGVLNLLATLKPPFLTYLHMWAPHEPYKPRKEFIDAFAGDHWMPSAKPPSALPVGAVDQKALNGYRNQYDEYILNVDHEFGRVYQYLQDAGIFDTSYVFVLSDHGQMFERGIHGHNNPTLYEALTRVPLLISQPGQKTRLDFHERTSHVDLLPTLQTLAGQPIPGWAEGQVLPGFGVDVRERPIYIMDAKSNSAFGAMTQGSFAINRENYKLIYYKNYPNIPDAYELYDLPADPDELNNLIASRSGLAGDLKNELQQALLRVNEPYLKK